MIKKTIKNLKKALADYEKRTGRNTQYHTPLSDNNIQWIEKKFNLHFPKNFKEFLRLVGGFNVAATEIFLTRSFNQELDSDGNIRAKKILPNGFEAYSDSMLYLTEEAINRDDSEFPKGFIMFEFIDDGGYYVLDCRIPDAEDAPVYVWEDAENYLDDEPIFPSFEARLEKEIEILEFKDLD